MPGSRITPDQKRRFAARLKDGWPIKDCSDFAGVSYAWGKAYAKGLQNSSGREWAGASSQSAEEIEAAVPLDMLAEVPAAALEDIALFATLYFGAVVQPWQLEATAVALELLDTPDEEWLVINCPPGSGKSTFFTKILPAWLTCRRRHIRGLIGSASMTMAKQYVGELKDIFASPVPLSQSPEAIARGYAVAPTRSLVHDFGKFKDDQRKWATDAFFVLQHGNAMFGAKEPTWQAFGRGSTFIGSRVDFCIWDDLYDPEQMLTPEAREKLKRWFTSTAESRLEPGGLFVLQGQRLDADDIYRFALDKKIKVIDAEGEETGEERTKYRHLKFPAHYEDRCKGVETHGRGAPAYPEGCLLFPKRLPWSKLSEIQANEPETFSVVYQQEDADPSSTLVKRVWVKGGTDPDTGEDAPGCWDLDRGLCELPYGLTPPLLSVVTVDPSDAQYWAFQWWVVHPASHQRFLMDCVRTRMSADRLLDWKIDEGRFTGIMEEWQRRSEALSFELNRNVRITTWVLEAVGAFKFLTAFDHSRRWRRENSVSFVSHDTNINKHDRKMGVTSIGPHWQYGRVRLPGKTGDPGRIAALKLVDEVVRYRTDGKKSGTDDQVMANWMLEWNLPLLLNSMPKEPVRQERPGFVTSSFSRHLAAAR